MFPILFVLPFLLGLPPVQPSLQVPADTSAVVVDDFESYTVGTFPGRWIHVTPNKQLKTYAEEREEGEEFLVAEEDGNKYLRIYTENEAQRYTLRNDEEFDEEFNWNLRTHPWLKWDWRARHLPEGASEKGKNDTGAALYVTFGTDWLGRPKSIKYTYSSSLSVGTVVSFGPLKVIVVDSKKEPRYGAWKTIYRNVVGDYKQVFGGRPPARPVSITIWSDSDTTGDVARVDFDDIMLLPAPP